MAKPVVCRIVDMPDGRFAVMAVLAGGKAFRHVGLATLAEAEESVEPLRALMDACGAPFVVERSEGSREPHDGRTGSPTGHHGHAMSCPSDGARARARTPGCPSELPKLRGRSGAAPEPDLAPDRSAAQPPADAQ